MRVYIAVTGLAFAVIVVIHIARVAAEGTGLLSNPFFVLPTLAAAGLALWAAWLLKPRSKSAK